MMVSSTDTTNVQSAELEAVFFENRLFLHCSFADNSQAQGCIVRLTLSSTNETESFQISCESGSMCTTANKQGEAYSRVIVLDWEENGMEGNLSLNLDTRRVSTLVEYTRLSECVEGIHYCSSHLYHALRSSMHAVATVSFRSRLVPIMLA